MNLSSVTDNIEAKIAAARQAAHEAAVTFNKQVMGSKAFFSSFSTWNKLNNELDSLEKVASLMQSSALAGLAKEAISSGIDRIFSTGIKFNPSMITAEAIQNAANGALFGQGALDTLGHALDGASQDIANAGSNNYMPYGGTSSGFSTFSGDNFPSDIDQGTSTAADFLPSGNHDSPYQYDGNLTSQNYSDTGSFVDTGASWGSVMSGEYMSNPNWQGTSMDNGNAASDHTRSISAWSGPSVGTPYDSGSSFNTGGTSSDASDNGYSGPNNGSSVNHQTTFKSDVKSFSSPSASVSTGNEPIINSAELNTSIHTSGNLVTLANAKIGVKVRPTNDKDTTAWNDIETIRGIIDWGKGGWKWVCFHTPRSEPGFRSPGFGLDNHGNQTDYPLYYTV